ncbi:MAG: peptidylprolyl isomerase, partial [Candidatus Eisenbacteria bacterium]|nr:peptidylprolyl isomerase [Candidatus Eisenbacteria bacterium]
LRSEVEEQFQVLAQQFQIAPGDTASSNQLHRDIVQRMVDDHLLYLEAKSQGIEAPTEEIEAQVQQALQDNKEALGEDGFREELKREGLTLEALESRWRDEATRQALAQRLVQRDVRPKVTVTEDGVRKFYEEHKSELPKRPRAVKIQDLFIQVRPDSAITKAALSRAREIRTKVQGGMSFADAATKLSDDPTSADRGGSLGRVRRGDLTPELEAIAFALPTGVVSEPIQTPYGYNLLQVDDKDPAGQWAEVRIILVEMKATRSDEAAAEERARAARAKIAGGMDFTEAVRKFSEDPPTRAKDGNLGWVAMQGFQGAVYDTVSKLAVGEVSQPTPGDNGYHIFRVLEEEPEREYQFDEIQDEIRQYYYQDELESHLRELLDQLKDKYYIERHDKW